MGTRDPPGEDEAEQLIDTRIDFTESDRLVAATVWRVPDSEAYPEGVKYAMHYGTKAATPSSGTTTLAPKGKATNATRRTESRRSTSPDGKHYSPNFGPRS